MFEVRRVVPVGGVRGESPDAPGAVVAVSGVCEGGHAGLRGRNRDAENAMRRARYRAANPLPERPCVVCGRLFTKRPDAVVCGERCRERRKAQRQGTGGWPARVAERVG